MVNIHRRLSSHSLTTFRLKVLLQFDFNFGDGWRRFVCDRRGGGLGVLGRGGLFAAERQTKLGNPRTAGCNYLGHWQYKYKIELTAVAVNQFRYGRSATVRPLCIIIIVWICIHT